MAMTREEPLEPQVVQVLLPDGDEEVRLASLDLKTKSLILRQVSLGRNKEVSLGGQATVKLASIGAVAVQDKLVKLRAGGQSGKVLLELRFEGADKAQIWSQALRKASSPDTPAASARTPKVSDAAADTSGAPALAAATAQTASTLRLLIQQQEEQVSLLEAIHQRKAEQVMNMRERLEVVLNRLNEGQAAYAAQQRVLDEQQRDVEALRGRLQAAAVAEAACEAAAAEAAAGWRNAQAAGSRVQTAPPVLQEEQELLDRHKALTAEKAEFEAQLRSLRELHAMMQVLGLGGSLAGEGDADSEDATST